MSRILKYIQTARARFGLYFHTLRYLSLRQILSRFTYHIKRSSGQAVKQYPAPTPGMSAKNFFLPDLDGKEFYEERYDVEEIKESHITLLHECRKLTFSRTEHEDATPLWQFNLQYMEYLIPLAHEYLVGKDPGWMILIEDIVLDWLQSESPHKYHPYVISKRLQNWLVVLGMLESDIPDDFRQLLLDSMYSQYLYLSKNLEHHLSANHLLENLLTSALCSAYFDSRDRAVKHVDALIRELSRQILPDGMHYELSLMYHKILLENLLRVSAVYEKIDPHRYRILIMYVEKMISAASSLEEGMGRTPLFNDAGDNVAKDLSALLKTSCDRFGVRVTQSNCYPDSGFYKLYDADISMIIDAGAVGPNENSGHGHCDCLSFELSVHEMPLFVNQGTYAYQTPWRSLFRSTEAHNTAIANAVQQSECWSEHRVARRSSHHQASLVDNRFRGSYRNYLGDTHSRTIELDKRVLIVSDVFSTRSELTLLESYLRVAEPYSVHRVMDRIIVELNAMTVCVIYSTNSEYEIVEEGPQTFYAPDFGQLQKCTLIRFRTENPNLCYIVDFRNGI